MTETTKKTDGEHKKQGKTLSGVVVSDKMKDTVTVLVTRFVKHVKYDKYMKRHKKYLAHDVGNTHKVGEKVTIREVRPISKRKTFAIVLGRTHLDAIRGDKERKREAYSVYGERLSDDSNEEVRQVRTSHV